MDKLISVAIPVYNGETTLRKCVDSILAQTYENIEVILVNDGSTDRSEDICRSYEQIDPRVKVISKENGGLSSARNAGIDKSWRKPGLLLLSRRRSCADQIISMVSILICPA